MQPSVPAGVLRRGFANAGRLLAGGGAAAVFALGATAVAARVLGSEGFGVLALAQAYALLVNGLFRFNAGPVLLRHATPLASRSRRGELAALLLFFAALDLAAGTVAFAVAQAGVRWLAPMLGWDEAARQLLAWYTVVILAVQTGTPLATLRLAGRFELVAWHRPLMPAVRLVGGIGVALAGGGLTGMALVWLISHLSESMLAWAWALAALRRRELLARPAYSPLAVPGRHPGLWSAVIAVNLGGTLGLVSNRLATLLVGTVLGAAAAGLFQLAAQIAGVVERGGEMVRRALEPELARLYGERAFRRLRRSVGRATWMLLAGAAALVMVAAMVAERLLQLAGGDGFGEAATLLRLLLARQLVVAAAVLAPPLLILAGRATLLLRIVSLVRLMQLAFLVPCLTLFGLEGAGLAALAVAVPEAVWLTAAARSVLASPAARGAAVRLDTPPDAH